MSINRDEGISEIQGEFRQGPMHIYGTKGNIRLDNSTLEKHLLFLGAIGTGKTNAIFQVVREIMRNMTTEDVAIIFDTKGDYLREFYNFPRPTRRQDDLVVSNFVVGQYNSARWNVFKDIAFNAPAKVDERVHEITATLYDEHVRRAKDTFFPYAAMDVTSATMIALLRAHQNPTNDDLVRFLYEMPADSLKNLLKKASSNSDLSGALQYIEMFGSQTQGVLSTIKIMVSKLFSSSFREPGDFSVRRFVHEKGGRALFIEYDVDAGSTLTPIYRVLFDLAIKEALSRRRSEGNVYFIIDEFALLPRLYHVDDGLNFGRSLGLKFVAGTQNVSQMLTAHGKSRGASLLSAFGSVFAFRVYDKQSREFVVDRYGSRRIKVQATQRSASGTVDGEQIVTTNVIEDRNITKLEVGECIASFPDGPPHYFTFKPYERNQL
jgi:type IV secretory pathway TraG/TraD family ATPase VirD4